jgi:hypothetical protein
MLPPTVPQTLCNAHQRNWLVWSLIVPYPLSWRSRSHEQTGQTWRTGQAESGKSDEAAEDADFILLVHFLSGGVRLHLHRANHLLPWRHGSHARMAQPIRGRGVLLRIFRAQSGSLTSFLLDILLYCTVQYVCAAGRTQSRAPVSHCRGAPALPPRLTFAASSRLTIPPVVSPLYLCSLGLPVSRLCL